MSVTTIQIPADHVRPVHQSLLSRRETLDRSAHPNGKREVEELDGLIRQLEADATADAHGPRRLTGSRVALWSAVYDSTCAAAERLAETCNEYWHSADAARARLEISLLSSQLDLLEELGPPPRS